MILTQESYWSKEEIGTMCKFLLDEGRVRFLEAAGFTTTRIIEYVPHQVTPENRLLLTVNKPDMNSNLK